MNDWKESKTGIEKIFSFKNFQKAMSFVLQISYLAEKANHHPDIFISYNKVKVTLTTHSEGNKVTEKDHLLAGEIDSINI